ncbi:hypothetical protein ACHAWF_012869 [Thalassiosira exigua]
MASKIPPHVARELRRHVAKSRPPPSSAGAGPSSPARADAPTSHYFSSFSRPQVLAGCLALTATMTVVPYGFVSWLDGKGGLVERDGALTGSQIRRGAFNNSGSRDVGRDPYWDFARGRRKVLGEDGCEDDGGYSEVLKGNDQDEIDHGEEFAAKSKRR